MTTPESFSFRHISNMMTTMRASELARCTRRSILSAIKSGALPAVKVGRGRDWKINTSDFDKWLYTPRANEQAK